MSLDDIRIVLIDPQHPGNIGASARAMKAMGLRRLYLVRPADYPSYEAERRAAGSLDVLSGAIVVEDASEAVGDCRLVIGASARARSHPLPVLDAREAAHRALEEASSGPVAVLFGPERTGLANEDLDRCNYWMRIPTSEEFSSLNLASAVQLFCYEVLVASREDQTKPATPPPKPGREHPSQSEMEFFYQHLQRTLDERGFTFDSRRAVTLAKLRRLFGRARPVAGELKLLHSLVRLMHREPEE